MRNLINIIVEANEAIPSVMTSLADEIKGKSWETAKRLIVAKVGSVQRGERFDDDVADAVFLRVQRNAQIGRYGDEETIRRLGRDEKRLEGDEPMTLYRAAPRGAGIRPGDFCTTSKSEAGYYLHGGHTVQSRIVPRHDVIAVRGSMGDGQELIYLPVDYVEPEPRVYYDTFRDFYDSAQG